LTLRQRTRQQFQNYLGPDCPGRYDYGYLCMIDDHDIGNYRIFLQHFLCINISFILRLENTTLNGGPFVSGEWSIFVPVGYYPLITPWLVQNRGKWLFLLSS
jgi:hypothetical protein